MTLWAVFTAPAHATPASGALATTAAAAAIASAAAPSGEDCPNRHSLAFCIAAVGGFTDGLNDGTGEVDDTRSAPDSPDSPLPGDLTGSTTDAANPDRPAPLQDIVGATMGEEEHAAERPRELALAAALHTISVAPAAAFNRLCAFLPKDSAPAADAAAVSLATMLSSALEQALGQGYVFEPGPAGGGALSTIRVSGSGACKMRDCVIVLPNEKIAVHDATAPAWMPADTGLTPHAPVWSACSAEVTFGIGGGFDLNRREIYQRMSAALPKGIFLYAAPDHPQYPAAAMFNQGKPLSFISSSTN